MKIIKTLMIASFLKKKKKKKKCYNRVMLLLNYFFSFLLMILANEFDLPLVLFKWTSPIILNIQWQVVVRFNFHILFS